MHTICSIDCDIRLNGVALGIEKENAWSYTFNCCRALDRIRGIDA